MRCRMRRFFLCALAAFSVAVLPLCASGDNFMEENAEVRIQNVMAKLRRGERVKIAALGGSITTGYNSNPINANSWAARTAGWFRSKAAESGCELTFANEGVSGTDSAFASVRVGDHIKAIGADMVILEFAMNDQWLDPKVRRRTYEGVIRQMMNGTDTAVLALFVNERKPPYSGQQYEQQPICEYYHIPYVSWKDCVFSANPNADFDEFFDGEESVHPNNAGHASIASFITEWLENTWRNLPPDSGIPSPVRELPVPLTDDGFEFPRYYHRDNISPVSNSGWTAGSPVHTEWVSHGQARQGWQSAEAGAEMTFELEGTSVGITYCESDQFRDAQAWVTLPDGTESPKVILNCFQANRRGYLGWAYKEIVSGAGPEKYTLHVVVSRRASKSREGKPANITGIIVTGKK